MRYSLIVLAMFTAIQVLVLNPLKSMAEEVQTRRDADSKQLEALLCVRCP